MLFLSKPVLEASLPRCAYVFGRYVTRHDVRDLRILCIVVSTVGDSPLSGSYYHTTPLSIFLREPEDRLMTARTHTCTECVDALDASRGARARLAHHQAGHTQALVAV